MVRVRKRRSLLNVYINKGWISPAAVSKLTQFRSPHIYLCPSGETLKHDGHFYVVSMPGEVNDPTQGVNV